MLVVEGYHSAPEGARGAVLALGNFDGVHRGHQALLDAALSEGTRRGRPAGALVFEPHPRELFRPNEPHFRLMSLSQKLEAFEHRGLDLAVVLPFDRALAQLSAAAFVEDVLVRGLAVAHVVVGYHFFYGRDRGGTVETLKAQALAQGFGLTVVAPVADEGEVFSSTSVRLHLAEGNVRAAAENLGRPWCVSGPVVGGAKRGTGLGYPTANIAMRPGTSLAHGIYAVKVRVGGHSLNGAAYIGTRPTYDDGAPMLEVFLFDFDGNLYGQTMEVFFIDRIRGDRKFSSSEELIRQMDIDCGHAREILAATPDLPRPKI